MKKILVLACIVLLPIGLIAQQGNGKREGYAKRMEQIKAEQVAFLTQEMDLTEKEAQGFWPAFNDFNKKKDTLIEARRSAFGKMKNCTELSEKELTNLANLHMELKMKEVLLEKEYHAKFMKVLPAGKVLKLYKAEHKFRSHLIKKYRNGHGNGQGNGNRN